MKFDAAATEQYFLTGSWKEQTYRGIPIYKFPTDLMTYHELIHEHQPQLIIETGTARGGSAAWYRDQQRLNSIGARVVTIDIERQWDDEQTGVHYILGDSVGNMPGGKRTSDYVASIAAGFDSMLISLDSQHTRDHVRDELNLYAPLVPVGSHLVVEDTFLGYMETFEAEDPFFDDNHPLAALTDFLNSDVGIGFEQVDEYDKYSISQHPGGWLRRIA